MPKGAIDAFDEINGKSLPGEPLVLQKVVGIGTHEIRRFPFEPWVSYMVRRGNCRRGQQ